MEGINRISPEAPVPILLQNTDKFNIGGAGNVAINIANLDGNVELYTVVSGKIMKVLQY